MIRFIDSHSINRPYKILMIALGLLLIAVLFNLMALAPVFADSPESLEITGDGVATPLKFTLAELEAMEQYEHVYSTVNTWPTKRWYTAKGVKLRNLFALAGIKKDARLIRFVSKDGYDVTLTVKELLVDSRYYFPFLKENHPTDGSIPGSPKNAQEVEPVLALLSAEGSDNPDNMNGRDSLHLILGQRAVTEQTNNLFLKYVSKIEVLTAEPEKWDKPKANIPDGTVLPEGTMLKLSNKGNNDDKIYYTTDGSTPTVNSPMFNWSASRWWPLRDNLGDINCPFEIKKDTVIKAITIGPGKEDSEVVTFAFTVDPTGKAIDPTKVSGGPPSGVILDRESINLNVGSTFRLDATVAPFNAADQRVTWSSSDTRVATVDNNGLVTVVGPGSAIITVKTEVGNYTASCIVNKLDQQGGDSGNLMLGSRPPEDGVPVYRQYLVEKDGTVPGVSDELLVPEGRKYYLAEKEHTAAAASNAGISLEQSISHSWQVYEMSIDTSFLPLKEQKDLHIYEAAIFLFLFLSGASKRYIESIKEQ